MKLLHYGILPLLLAFCCYGQLAAQTMLVGYEYWFDQDIANKTAVSVAPAEELLVNFDANAAALSDGMHTLHSWFVDSNGKYSTPTASFFYKLPASASPNPTIVGYEYWFDQDIANKTTVSVAPTEELLVNFDVNAAALSYGMHTLHTRFIDLDGTYSSAAASSVYKLPASASPDPLIVGYEYWFDQDIANKTTVTIAPTEELLVNFDVNASALSYGMHTLHTRFVDSDGTYSSAAASSVYKLPSSASPDLLIVGYEYWFDQDIANKTTVTVAPTEELLVNFDVNASALSYGMHTLHTRFVDSDGTYSSDAASFFYKIPTSTLPDYSIVGYEYWFDQDIANKIEVSVSPSEEYLVNFEVNASALSYGMHTLHTRYVDSDSTYSSDAASFFYKLPTSTLPDYSIVEYEYWFDQDIANKTVVSVPAAEEISINFEVNASALSYGMHTLHTRYVDSDGTHSSDAASFFYKLPAANLPDRTIVGYEYWFDTDISNRSYVAATPGKEVLMLEDIDASNLPEGLHTLYVRFKDNTGHLGSAEETPFRQLRSTPTGPVKVMAYRWWIDQDFANHTYVPVNPPIVDLDIMEALDLSNFILDTSCHVINFELLDNKNYWSSVVQDSFCYEYILPVELFEFTVRRQAEDALLQWKTASEVDINYYEIEKSTDGITFSPIGQMPASGSATDVEVYEFLDTKLKEAHFSYVYYRIKIVETTSEVDYSEIKSLKLRQSVEGLVSIYPNPANESVTILIYTKGTDSGRLELLDVSGRILDAKSIEIQSGAHQFEFDLSRLAAGMYFIRWQTSRDQMTKKIRKL